MAKKKRTSPVRRGLDGIVLVVAGAVAATWRACFLEGAALGAWARVSLVFPQLDEVFYAACALCVVVGAVLLWCATSGRREAARDAARIRALVGGESLGAEEFLAARAALLARGDFTGIYVLHNRTQDSYYVGQSTRVVGRVAAHLTGHGNGDVYADYAYGDAFEVSLVSLAGSGYESLDALERDAIRTYGAYERGYNRTRGNRN